MNQTTTASTFGETAAHGLHSAGRGDGAAAFRRAMRHSRHVRLLRIAVPAGFAVLLAAALLAAWLDPFRIFVRLPGDAGKLVISGTKITMEQPKLSGYTRDARWYELTARAAAHDITRPDLVELLDIRAKLEMQDKSTMDLTAADGVFDRKAGVLTLSRKILLKSTSGAEVHLSEAVIDTGSGAIVSEKPVEVRMQQGTLNANRLEVSKAGEVVRFDGGVVMTLQPSELPQADGQAVKP